MELKGRELFSYLKFKNNKKKIADGTVLFTKTCLPLLQFYWHINYWVHFHHMSDTHNLKQQHFWSESNSYVIFFSCLCHLSFYQI